MSTDPPSPSLPLPVLPVGLAASTPDALDSSLVQLKNLQIFKSRVRHQQARPRAHHHLASSDNSKLMATRAWDGRRVKACPGGRADLMLVLLLDSRSLARAPATRPSSLATP